MSGVPDSNSSTSILAGNGQMARLGDSVLPARVNQERRKIQLNCSNISDKDDSKRRTVMEVLTDFPMSERCTVPNSNPSATRLEGNSQGARLGDLVLPARADEGRRKIQSKDSGSNSSDTRDGGTRTLMEVLTDFPSESDIKGTVWKYLKSKLMATYIPGSSIRCSMCQYHLHQRSFSEKVLSAAYIHIVTHTDIRPFVCNYCDYGDKSAGAMLEHVKSVHPKHVACYGIFNVFANNTLQYITELTKLVDKCYCKSGLISFNQNGDSSVMRILRGYCQRIILEYLKPTCALDCTLCGAVLSELWVSEPTTSEQSNMVALDGQAAFEHVLGHCRHVRFTCRHCPLLTQDYVYMKRHVQWSHQSGSIRGIRVVEMPLCYKEIEKMIDQCFRKIPNYGIRLNSPKEPQAKKRRLLETTTMPNEICSGVSSIPSTNNVLAMDSGRSMSPDQESSENDQESKIDPMPTTSLIGSGITSETASSASSSIVSGNDFSSGWTVLVKCEVVDSTPVLIPTDELVLKELKKEEPDFD